MGPQQRMLLIEAPSTPWLAKLRGACGTVSACRSQNDEKRPRAALYAAKLQGLHHAAKAGIIMAMREVDAISTGGDSTQSRGIGVDDQR